MSVMRYTYFMVWSAFTDSNGDIHVRIDGYLDAKGGVNSANQVLRLLDGQVRDLVIEVENMTGYDRSARLAWQGLLWDHRGLIRRIVMIGADASAKITGSVLARHLEVPLVVMMAEHAVEEDAPVRRSRPRSRSGPLPWDVTRPISRPSSMPSSIPLAPQLPGRASRLSPARIAKPAERSEALPNERSGPQRQRSGSGSVMRRPRKPSQPEI